MNEKTATGTEQRGGERQDDWVRDPAKFGQPRREDDGARAAEAQALNNADPVHEVLDGRCSYDGLPVGNCAHFPGPQLVVDDGDYASTQEKAARRESAAKEPRKS